MLPGGHTVTTTWNGHGADDSRTGPQLIEFDEQGEIVWQWHDPERAGSLLSVLVLDRLDTEQLLQENEEGEVTEVRPRI